MQGYGIGIIGNAIVVGLVEVGVDDMVSIS
jgi:hypothetical protein